MKLVDKKAILEGVKEFIRTAIMAIVPVLIVQLQTGGQIDLRPTLVALAISGLSALDKWAHQKDIESPLDLKSLDKLL